MGLMSDGPRLVVVAHPRSGSNALVEILRCHPDLTLLNEPFNENFSSWLPANPDYRAQSPTSPPSTRWSTASWPITPGSSCTPTNSTWSCWPICCPGRTCTSCSYAGATCWRRWCRASSPSRPGYGARGDRERDLEAYYTDLAPLPVENVRELLRWTLEDLADVAAVLRARGDGRAMELFYEDMFLANRTTRWRLVESLWSHLGLPPCANPRVGGFLDNASFRMGGPATYGRLPNLAGIEAALGNDDTGHIGYLARVERPAAEA